MIYVITSGSHSDYNIQRYLYSEDKQDLELRQLEFRAQYGYPLSQVFGVTWKTREEYDQITVVRNAAGEKMRQEFPDVIHKEVRDLGNIWYINAFFMAWLMKYKGFTDAEDIEEFQLDD